MTRTEAHECNIDTAQRELDRRAAEGEDVSMLQVCQRTAQIIPVDMDWVMQEEAQGNRQLSGDY